MKFMILLFLIDANIILPNLAEVIQDTETIRNTKEINDHAENELSDLKDYSTFSEYSSNENSVLNDPLRNTIWDFVGRDNTNEYDSHERGIPSTNEEALQKLLEFKILQSIFLSVHNMSLTPDEQLEIEPSGLHDESNVILGLELGKVDDSDETEDLSSLKKESEDEEQPVNEIEFTLLKLSQTKSKIYFVPSVPVKQSETGTSENESNSPSAKTEPSDLELILVNSRQGSQDGENTTTKQPNSANGYSEQDGIIFDLEPIPLSEKIKQKEDITLLKKDTENQVSYPKDLEDGTPQKDTISFQLLPEFEDVPFNRGSAPLATELKLKQENSPENDLYWDDQDEFPHRKSFPISKEIQQQDEDNRLPKQRINSILSTHEYQLLNPESPPQKLESMSQKVLYPVDLDQIFDHKTIPLSKQIHQEETENKLQKEANYSLVFYLEEQKFNPESTALVSDIKQKRENMPQKVSYPVDPDQVFDYESVPLSKQFLQEETENKLQELPDDPFPFKVEDQKFNPESTSLDTDVKKKQENMPQKEVYESDQDYLFDHELKPLNKKIQREVEENQLQKIPFYPFLFKLEDKLFNPESTSLDTDIKWEQESMPQKEIYENDQDHLSDHELIPLGQEIQKEVEENQLPKESMYPLLFKLKQLLNPESTQLATEIKQKQANTQKNEIFSDGKFLNLVSTLLDREIQLEGENKLQMEIITSLLLSKLEELYDLESERIASDELNNELIQLIEGILQKAENKQEKQIFFT